ncbi:MAG: hypothetical protein RL557_1084 [archaeon]
MKKEDKRGVFFSTDALIAVIIILLSLIVVFPLIQYSSYETRIPSNVLNVLSTLTIGSVNNSYAKDLIAQGKIKDLNKSVLEQIGEFYITNITIARTLGDSLLANLNTTDNIGIWYENTLIASKNKTSVEQAKNIELDRQTITGIQEGGSVTGFSARAFFSSAFQKKYFYFGGYVGDGNISSQIIYDGQLQSAEMELVASKNFDLYINDVYSGSYQNSSSEFTPVSYDISAYKNNFHAGENTVVFVGNNLHIAGGFIKIGVQNVTTTNPTRYYFPGIQGLINVYDGFSIPGNISSLKISLHLNTPHKAFLTIGNKTVFSNITNGEEIKIIDNDELDALLDYQSISGKTVPIRFGLENLSYGNFSGNADVVLITDTSGSMDWRLDSDVSGTARNCNDSLLYNPSTKRISLAKCLDNDFVSTIVNNTNGNRVSLVSFSSSATNYINLTGNLTLLKNTINEYTASGGTCVSCAINRAYTILESQSSPNRQKFIIMMTDGVTNYRSTNACYNMNGISYNNTLAALVGINGAIVHYNNTWSNVSSPTTNTLHDVDFASDTLGFAVSSSYQIFRWNGLSWNLEQDLGSQTLYGVDLFNSTLGFAVGDSGKIAVWNGVSWSEQTDIGNLDLYDIKIFNRTLAFAVGSSGVIYRWNGNSWTLHQDLGSQNLYGVDILNGTYAFAVGNSGKIYRWLGNTWSEQQDLGSMSITDVSFFNHTLAFAPTNNNRIYSWTGGSWSSVYTGSYGLESIKIINRTLGFAVGDSKEGVVSWDGNSWTHSLPPYLYEGIATNGISCSDDDSCSLVTSIPMLNANYSACRAHKDTNATIHSIGFGPVATCNFAAITLQSIAQCGNGSYYASSNATQLQQFYASIAQNIINLSYAGQISFAVGNISTRLYADSFIEFNYTQPNEGYGLVITTEKKFSDAYSGSFEIPSKSIPIEVHAVSYSGPRWTDRVETNNNTIYRLSDYGNDYIKLGDPYHIQIPLSTIVANNTILITTAISPANATEGSSSNKIIYSLLKNFTSYSSISAFAEGCVWTVDFEDSNLSFNIPSSYTGDAHCYYQQGKGEYDSNDALQGAVYRLLQSLDFDLNGKVDVKFIEQDFQIGSSEVIGIPFSWSTEVQVRRWT